MIWASQKGKTLCATPLLLALGLAVASCATSPRFEGEDGVREARSFQRALWECGRYEMPVPAHRPADFRPFVSCVTLVEELHRPGPASRFSVFAREARDRYRSVSELSWS